MSVAMRVTECATAAATTANATAAANTTRGMRLLMMQQRAIDCASAMIGGGRDAGTRCIGGKQWCGLRLVNIIFAGSVIERKNETFYFLFISGKNPFQNKRNKINIIEVYKSKKFINA